MGGWLRLSASRGQEIARVRWKSEATNGMSAADALTKLSFPSLDQELFVAEGASKDNLLRGPAHIAWSAAPGRNGNCIIVAHRDTHFRLLKDVRKDQHIVLERSGRTFEYRIVALRVIEPNDNRFYKATSRSVLTLVTCYPFWYLGRAPKRFIVRAELLESDSG
jgi:sortase A